MVVNKEKEEGDDVPGSWTCWTTSREGGQSGQCGQRGGGGHGGGERREGGYNGYEKKDEEMVYQIAKEKPFILEYVPIFLYGIVKVGVVVMKVVNDNNDEGEKKRK